MIETKDSAAEALQHGIQDVDDPEAICIGKIRCDGGLELQEDLKHWQNHVELPSKLTPLAPLKETPLLSVVLTPLLVSPASYFWELLTFPRKFGLKPSQPWCTQEPHGDGCSGRKGAS